MSRIKLTSQPFFYFVLGLGILGVFLMCYSWIHHQNRTMPGTETELTSLLPENNQAAAKNTTPELTVWVTYNDEQFTAYKKVVADFEASHNVKIHISKIPFQGQGEKFMYACTSHTAPDIARMDIGLIPKFAVGKALLPMDDLYKKHNWMLEDILKAALESGRIRTQDGQMKLFAVPDEFTELVLFYNKDLFEEAGLDPASPPRTWDEFKRMAASLTVDRDGDGNPDQYGFAMENTLWWSLPFVYTFGGNIIDEDKMKCRLNEPETVKALDFQISLYKEGLEAGAWKKGAFKPDAGFKNKTYAMILSGPWNLKSFEKVNFDISLIPGSETRASTTSVGGNSNVIFRTCKHPELAFEFLAYLASKEVQEYFLNQLNAIPVNRQVKINTENPTQREQHMKLLMEQATYAIPRPRIPGYDIIENLVNNETETAFRGDRSSQDAYNEACSKITDEILSELQTGTN
jgi:multiple sugar transport system substrate-binding protein